MKKTYISLRMAVIFPLIVVVISVLTISLVRSKTDYEFLAKEQGSKIVEALSDNTQNKLNSILSEPLRTAELIANIIGKEKMFLGEDLSKVEEYQVTLMKRLKKDLPQISVISYGDENGNYVGIRDNGQNKGYSLMLKDKRTDGKLNIYEGEYIVSKVINSYEGYDPRVRPWYEPAKTNLKTSWSEIYINYDEKMEATTSVSVPVFDENQEFKGVFEIDVKLSGINEFLKNNKVKGNGAVFLLNEKLEVIAHSEKEENIIVKSKNPPEGKLLKIGEIKNELIKSSEKVVSNQKVEYGKIKQVKLLDKSNFVMVSKLSQPRGLDWKIVVLIPEDNLMGKIKSRYSMSLSLIIIIIGLGTLSGIFVLNKITKPILMIAKGARKISDGDWDVEIKENQDNIRETHEMILGFNLMIKDIKEYIKKLVEAQEEIESLHRNEKERMENLIEEKTANLKDAMEELMEKEKLASLGGLVSGVAHEINTPLGVAVSAASLMEVNNEKYKQLLKEGNLTKTGLISYMESVEETTAILSSNLLRAAELVKSFKAIAVNQASEERTKFNFNEYIGAILLSLKHEYKNRDIKFEVDCPTDLVVDNYSGAFSQIFTNLIMNSLIHGFKDNKSGVISIKVESINDILKIEYSDNGNGMSEEVRRHIFEPFFTTNRGKGGSGLGLNIVYNLVSGKMNGKIGCKSELGVGTKFIMEFRI